MHICWTAALPFLFQLGASVGPGREMQVWQETRGSLPVFFQMWHVSSNDDMGPGKFDALYGIAQQYFINLAAREDAPTRDGSLLVAAFFDPGSRIVYASSIPRDKMNPWMVTEGAVEAPVWLTRAYAYSPNLHAEDGAYFAFEYWSGDYNGLDLTTAADTRYPQGSKVAVWGYITGDSPSTKKTGRKVGLCYGQQSGVVREPACRETARNLGIEFDPDRTIGGDYPAALAAALAAPNNAGSSCDANVVVDKNSVGPVAVSSSSSIPPQRLRNRSRNWALNEARQAANSTSVVPTAADPVSSDLPPLPTLTGAELTAAVSSVIASAELNLAPCPNATTLTESATYNPSTGTFSINDINTLPPPAPASVTAMPTTAAPTTLSTAVATAASFGCNYQKPDPGSGKTSAFCICSQGPATVTAALPRNAAGDAIPSGTNSCPYSTYPGSAAITPTTTLGPATTNLAACQVCTPVEVNEDSCTTISGCTAQIPVATISIGSSPVNVGTLTSSALYTSVSSALESLCPSAVDNGPVTGTACDGTAKATISSIAYASEDDEATDGELVIGIETSNYNSTALRDFLITMLATSAQQAATGKNCYVPEGSAGVGNANPDPSDTFCSTANSYEANYFNQFWRLAPTPSPTDFIHVSMEFVAKPDLSLIFACEFADLAIDAFAALDPETIPGDIGLEEGINLICEDQEANKVQKSTTDEA